MTYCMNSGWIAFDEVTLTRYEQVYYYYAGGQRVAMKNNGVLYWLLQDHLGSTTIIPRSSGQAASSTGSETGEVRYYPWGQEHYNSGTTPTSFRFTEQRQDYYINFIGIS